jgi:hypothetical protein
MKILRARVKNEGEKIIKRASEYTLGGTDIFLVPKDVKTPRVIKVASGDEFHQAYFASWMMKIPKECCC